MQLQTAGKSPQPGQRVRFIHTCGQPDVWAWERPDALRPQRVAVPVYRKLMLRTAADIFQPFGLDVPALSRLLDGNAAAVPLSPRFFRAASRRLLKYPLLP